MILIKKLICFIFGHRGKIKWEGKCNFCCRKEYEKKRRNTILNGNRKVDYEVNIR